MRLRLNVRRGLIAMCLIGYFYAADEAAANPVLDNVDLPAVAMATPPGEEHDAVKPSISVESRRGNEIVLIDILLYDVSTFMDFVQANKQGLATVMFWDMCEVFRSLCADGKVLHALHTCGARMRCFFPRSRGSKEARPSCRVPLFLGQRRASLALFYAVTHTK
jgi:hypothetical protein